MKCGKLNYNSWLILVWLLAYLLPNKGTSGLHGLHTLLIPKQDLLVVYIVYRFNKNNDKALFHHFDLLEALISLYDHFFPTLTQYITTNCIFEKISKIALIFNKSTRSSNVANRVSLMKFVIVGRDIIL